MQNEENATILIFSRSVPLIDNKKDRVPVNSDALSKESTSSSELSINNDLGDKLGTTDYLPNGWYQREIGWVKDIF